MPNNPRNDAAKETIYGIVVSDEDAGVRLDCFTPNWRGLEKVSLARELYAFRECAGRRDIQGLVITHAEFEDVETVERLFMHWGKRLDIEGLKGIFPYVDWETSLTLVDRIADEAYFLDLAMNEGARESTRSLAVRKGIFNLDTLQNIAQQEHLDRKVRLHALQRILELSKEHFYALLSQLGPELEIGATRIFQVLEDASYAIRTARDSAFEESWRLTAIQHLANVGEKDAVVMLLLELANDLDLSGLVKARSIDDSGVDCFDDPYIFERVAVALAKPGTKKGERWKESELLNRLIECMQRHHPEDLYLPFIRALCEHGDTYSVAILELALRIQDPTVRLQFVLEWGGAKKIAHVYRDKAPKSDADIPTWIEASSQLEPIWLRRYPDSQPRQPIDEDD